ncbi:hypothetical protein [Lentzea cavernae]|uniref:Uncharacterized protein n=1 Tax=Lentzea cavernae TaxID=2020703 RepID=A0ABQ3MTR1_9PSEU|nr:hypothetical protein [Lentzea cavernae]GHH57486.1 hypothetical protein GCM10017774_77050 [Lentzea cavernae]
MAEWKVRVGYLPRELVDEMKSLMDKIPDESVQYEVMRFVERAHASGYEAAYIRYQIEESWRQFRANDTAAKQPHVVELDATQIPEHLKISDVQAVFRAAGLQVQIEVDGADQGSTSR